MPKGLTPKDLLQLLDFVQFFKQGEDYPCTTEMIETICYAIESQHYGFGISEQIDLIIGLMYVQITPVLDLVNDFLDNVTQLQFESTCAELLGKTKYFEYLTEKNIHFLDEDDLGVVIKKNRQKFIRPKNKF